MLCEELELFLLIFGRRIRFGDESELTGDGDNRGEWENGRRAQKDEWVRENRK